MITNPDAKVTLGSLDLMGTVGDIATVGYCFEVQGADLTWGNPVPIDEVIGALLVDGSLVETTSNDNRTAKFLVTISAEDSDGLAKGGQALHLQTGRRSALVWTPPDGVGEPCVFDVLTSSLEFKFDEMNEIHLQRVYALEITAAPFARASQNVKTTRPAPSGSQSFTTIDACTATTGWSSSFAGNDGVTSSPTVSTSGGRVNAGRTYDGSGPLRYAELTMLRTGLAVPVSTKPYVRIEVTGLVPGGDWDAFYAPNPIPGAPNWGFKINGINVTVVSQNGSAYWVDLTGTGITTINSVRINVGYIPRNGSGIFVSVGDISQANVLGDQSTFRQLARTIPIQGSARTEGSLQVADAANGLGLAIVYTAPAAGALVQPPLRSQLSSGNSTTPDGNLVSGFYSDLGTLHSFDIPANGLLPGTHVLMALVRHPTVTATRSFAWAARSRVGSTNLGDAQTGSLAENIVAGSTWTLVTIGTMVLPPKKVGSAGVVRIELTGEAGVQLDEAWIFNTDMGALTIVQCGTGAAAAGSISNRLWIDSPTIESPADSIWLGTQADRSDSFHAGSELVAADRHEIEPSTLNVFTVTTGSTASALTVDYPPRFHTHVARPAA